MSNVPEAPTYRSGATSVAPLISTPASARAAALQFLDTLAAEVSSGSVDLPCFPNIVIQIRNTLADPATTPETTVRIVGAEPRLTARLLQTANSAAFNQSGKPLTDLRSAITRLGHQLVQSAAMAFAVQHMKNEQSLRSVTDQLSELWKDSITVASICLVVARRSKVSPEEAFLTGLLHGIGAMYIIVRAVGKLGEFGDQASFMDTISGWHASIGKAVLENWGFAEEIAEAVGEQNGRDRELKRNHEADLTDILIVAVTLAEAQKKPQPRTVEIDGVGSFAALRLTTQHCDAIMAHAERQLGSLQQALGC
jgi:HD-like signal output (HDOD) protein